MRNRGGKCSRLIIRSVTWLALVSVAICLSGCGRFTSEAPLVNVEQAAFPFAAITIIQKDEKEPLADLGTLYRSGSVYVMASAAEENGQDSVSGVRLRHLEAEDYVAQLTSTANGKPDYAYAFVRLDLAGKTIQVFASDPNKADIGPGLRDCSEGSVTSICIDDLSAYIKLAKSVVAAGKAPDASFQILESRSVLGSLNQGLAAYHRADYLEALTILRPLATDGDAVAQLTLGIMYYSGTGVLQDDGKAARLFRKAADQGDGQAQNNLGQMYENGRGVSHDACEAAKWYRLSADQGNELALKNQRDLLSGAHAPQGPCEDGLQLSSPNRWVQVASRRDLNDAIAIAQTFAAQKSRVVLSQNGWYAVVLGPYAAADIGSFRKTYAGPSLPDDTWLTHGTGYLKTALPAPLGATSRLQDQPVADRSDKEICNYALTTAQVDWDLSGTYTRYVAEAKRRNLSIADCRAALGLAELSETLVATKAAQDLCDRALNLEKEDWDHKDDATYYVAEAKRRNLSVDDCRVALGLPRPPLLLQDMPVRNLCNVALNNDKNDWDATVNFAAYVVEAKRRNLGVDDCRMAIGLPPLAPPLQDLASTALCKQALTYRMDDWDGVAAYATYVAEAKRRNLSVDDCRTAVLRLVPNGQLCAAQHHL